MDRRQLVVVSVGLLLAFCSAVQQAAADIGVCTDLGYCGTDGVLNPGSNVTINLAAATTAAWNAPSPSPGSGVYDPDKWAVVFKYAFVNIPAGVTVSFSNHPSGAPVVWLVQGDVIINGAVNLNGAGGANNTSHAEPGPGGFRGGQGGQGSLSSTGCGPGGGNHNNGFALYATYIYGNPIIVPLIGGSGGAGSTDGTTVGGGGAGGGAILIACNSDINLNGSITANGGGGAVYYPGYGYWTGGGSGGGIRLIADVVLGTGIIRAQGGLSPNNTGGLGRTRVEANSITLIDPGDPAYTVSFPTDPVNLWADSTLPRIDPVSLAGQAISSDPAHSFSFPTQEVLISNGVPVPLLIEAYNVPSASQMTVRVVPKSGSGFTVPATQISGDTGFSMWQANVLVPSEISAVQVRAVLP